MGQRGGLRGMLSTSILQVPTKRTCFTCAVYSMQSYGACSTCAVELFMSRPTHLDKSLQVDMSHAPARSFASTLLQFLGWSFSTMAQEWPSATFADCDFESCAEGLQTPE